MSIKNISSFWIKSLIVGVSLTFSSCEKILELDPKQSIDSSTALESQDGIESTLISVYSRLQNYQHYGRDMLALAEALSDNAIHTGNSSHLINEAANNRGSHFDLWQNCYYSINEINLVLEALENSAGQYAEGWANDIYGQLYLPKSGAAELPGMIYIHGGPRRQMYMGWHSSSYYHNDYLTNQYLASRGVAVLVLNYRMGTGYGYDFQNPENAGTLGASEYQDVLAAGKWLQKQRGINSNNIGLFGGSYGGYLTAMGLGKNSDIFKYGVDVHGVHNREKKQNLDFFPPDYDLASKVAWQSSPSKYVKSWKSPVLIIHGDDDQNVAFSQSIDLVNRLMDNQVEVETLVLPDENHHWMLHENLIKVKVNQVDFLLKKAKEVDENR